MNAREAYILSSPRGQHYEELRLAASEGRRQQVFSLLTDDYLALSDEDKLACELNFWPALMEDFRSNGYKVTFDKETSQLIIDWSHPFADDKGLDEKLWNDLKKELLDFGRSNNPILGSDIERTLRSTLEGQIKERGSDVINGMMKACLEALPMIRMIAPNLLGGFFQSNLGEFQSILREFQTRPGRPEQEIKAALRDIN